jgi:hypothetical protein
MWDSTRWSSRSTSPGGTVVVRRLKLQELNEQNQSSNLTRLSLCLAERTVDEAVLKAFVRRNKLTLRHLGAAAEGAEGSFDLCYGDLRGLLGVGEAEELWDAYAKAGRGQREKMVDLREVLTGLLPLVAGPLEQKIKLIFELWDAHQTGFLPRRTFVRVLAACHMAGLKGDSIPLSEVVIQSVRVSRRGVCMAEFWVLAESFPELLSRVEPAEEEKGWGASWRSCQALRGA